MGVQKPDVGVGQPSGRGPTRLAHRAATLSPDALLLIDFDGAIAYANPAARALFGDAVDRALVSDLIRLDGPPVHHLVGGPDVTRLATVSTPVDGAVEADVVVGAPRDDLAPVTVRRRVIPEVSTVELLRRATHDDMTQLANRASLLERIGRDSRPGHALILADLDGFKQVNDGYGHEVGDQVLVEVARRLRRNCRPDDLVARLGGDEFGIWCPGVSDPQAVTPLVHRLLQAIEEPIPVAGAHAAVSAALGVVVVEEVGTEPAELLARADAAMYRAKGRGWGSHVVYDADIGLDLDRARNLERSLGQAIADQQVELHYQPVVDAIGGTVVGAESLVRWCHPDLGMIPASELIEVAARTHLAGTLTTWVTRTAIAQLRRWDGEGVGRRRLALNVSVSQLTDSFVDLVAATVVEASVDPSLVTIEVTEDVLSPRRSDLPLLLEHLHGVGVRVAIDDFGTGASSLAALAHLHVDALKVDPVLVSGVAHSKRQSAIVEAIASMAHALGLEVVAEGVENRADLDAARDLGCDLVQGFLLGRPVPAHRLDWSPRPPPPKSS